MKTDELSGDNLISAYREAAIAQDFDSGGDFSAKNKAADKLAKIYAELRKRGSATQRLLIPLLQDAEDNVRIWAAAHALEFAPELGRPVLETLASGKGITPLNARMTLAEFDKGELHFP